MELCAIMKRCGIVVILNFALALSAQDPPSPRVPDSTTAVAIAGAAARKIYGKRQIDYEEPLTALLANGVWIVHGTLCCPDRNGKRVCEIGKCVGGVVEVKVRQRDGKILSMTHGK